MKTVALGDVASIERRSVKPDAIGDGDLYIGLEHIDSDGKVLHAQTVRNGELKSGKYSFGPHHILFGKLRPYLAKIATVDFSGVCSTDILPIRPGPDLDQRFLLHYLRTPHMVRHAAKLSVGINLPRLSPKTLETFPVPLPPLPEQRRIASILDAADALRTKRRQAIAKLDTLTQAIFIDMFGSPETAVSQYGYATLSELGEMRNGLNFSADERGDGTSGVVMLDVKNMYSPDITPELHSTYRVETTVSPNHLLEAGDLLFVRSSVKREGVAWPTWFAGHHEPVAFCGFLIRCRLGPEMRRRFLPEFLINYFRQPTVRMAAVQSAGQVAITNVSQKRLGQLRVPTVPMESQTDFSDRLLDITRIRNEANQHLTESEVLFSALQQRAFRGEL